MKTVARIQRPHFKMRTNQAFTIVELLIVIVVIGILAAITIVAYNGVTDKAHNANALADAKNVSDLLGRVYATSGSYPTDLSTIDNGNPMPSGDGTTYVYHPQNGNANYCVTVTNATHSYYVTDSAGSPASGGCPGDGVGGVPPITNLAVNPSIETDMTFIHGFTSASGGAAADSIASGGAVSGNNYYHMAITAGTGGTGGIYESNIPVTAGQTYTASASVRTNTAKTMIILLEWHSASSGLGNTGSAPFTSSASWQRVSVTGQAPTGAVSVTVDVYVSGSSYWNTGDTEDEDAIMVTQGSKLYNYADGNTASWIWTGTTNGSSSTGPPQ